MRPVVFSSAFPRILGGLLLLTLATGVQAQRATKVYISVDMEGISGVNSENQTSPAGAEYGRARKLMVEDANAAIRGAFEGGATDVLVNDSHGGQRNLLPEDLDPRARLISHSFKRHGMMEGLDESFDAVIFVGYHAKAGSPRGLFAHTGAGVLAGAVTAAGAGSRSFLPPMKTTPTPARMATPAPIKAAGFIDADRSR